MEKFKKYIFLFLKKKKRDFGMIPSEHIIKTVKFIIILHGLSSTCAHVTARWWRWCGGGDNTDDSNIHIWLINRHVMIIIWNRVGIKEIKFFDNSQFSSSLSIAHISRSKQEKFFFKNHHHEIRYCIRCLDRSRRRPAKCWCWSHQSGIW